MATCARCGVEKPDDAFTPHGHGYRDRFCRDCYNARRRQRYSADPAFAAKRVAAAVAYKRTHPDKHREQFRRAYAKDPERTLARIAVQRAVRLRRLTPAPCWCGAIPTEAHHHRGYAREHRLDVVWLCKAHHQTVHS